MKPLLILSLLLLAHAAPVQAQPAITISQAVVADQIHVDRAALDKALRPLLTNQSKGAILSAASDVRFLAQGPPWLLAAGSLGYPYGYGVFSSDVVLWRGRLVSMHLPANDPLGRGGAQGLADWLEQAAVATPIPAKDVAATVKWYVTVAGNFCPALEATIYKCQVQVNTLAP